jgi:V/A-type H+-transporting ATPase subunit I
MERNAMIEPMVKVRLVSPRNLVEGVTSTLLEIGVLHFESSPMEAAQIPLHPQVMDESSLQRRVALQRLDEDLRRLLLLLPELPPGRRIHPDHAPPRKLSDQDIRQLADLIRGVAARIDELSACLKSCGEELALLSRYEKALAALAPFLPFIEESEELDHLGVTITKQEGVHQLVPLLRDTMARITDNRYELFHAQVEEHSLVVLLIFPKTYGARIRGLLWEEGITELRLPASVSEKPFGEALRILLERKAQLPLEAMRHRRELDEVSLRWRPDFVAYQEAVSRCLQESEASRFFFQTDMATFVYGWVPRRAFDALAVKVREGFGGKVVLEDSPVSRREWSAVPVVLRNPGWLRPFETLTRVIALPQYGSIDPTPYLALFFPLFYGIILGDVGYGLLLLLGTALVRRRYGRHPLIRDLTSIFFAASAMAFLFGFMFGDVFGQLGERVGLHPVVNRMEAFIPLLVMSLGIGTMHVVLGIALGAWSAWDHEDRRECLAKCGGLTLVISFLALIASVAGLLPREWTSGEVVGLLGSLAIVFLMGGSRGPMELHNLVNVLSYLRLMGIGVASAALAFAANKLGGMASNAFLAIAIAGTLHGLNLIFGILSPTIQSLRLHYVEFFENFFVPGGRSYRPFCRPTGIPLPSSLAST